MWVEEGRGPPTLMLFSAVCLWFCPEVADHEWVAICDADEFLIPVFEGTRCQSIADYLYFVEARFSASAVCLNWKWFPGDIVLRSLVWHCLREIYGIPRE